MTTPERAPGNYHVRRHGSTPWETARWDGVNWAYVGYYGYVHDDSELFKIGPRIPSPEEPSDSCGECGLELSPMLVCTKCDGLEAQDERVKALEAEVAELWGSLCPDCGPDDPVKVIRTVITEGLERHEKLTAAQALIRLLFSLHPPGVGTYYNALAALAKKAGVHLE